MKNHQKRLLITQQELSFFAGSEIVTLELSEYALNLGFEVSILTNYYGLPISNEFDRRVRIIGPDEELALRDYTHLWIHHNFIPTTLIENYNAHNEAGWKLPKVAFHHMSPFLPIESPLLYEIENNIADEIFCNSKETKEAYESVLRADNVTVLGNPAPDGFYREEPGNTDKKDLKKILVVSNHPPTELLIALDKLTTEGIEYTVFGSPGKPKRITPDVIDNFDLIVSIGKTVQYALARGVVVYCYDHFGGPGYLTEDNYQKSAALNFSGRGFTKKSAEDIALEIVDQFSDAARKFNRLHSLFGKKVLLSVNLDTFFLQPNSKRRLVTVISEKERLRAVNLIKSQSSLVRSIVHHRLIAEAREQEVRESLARYDHAQEELKNLQQEAQALREAWDSSIDMRLRRIAKSLSNRLPKR